MSRTFDSSSFAWPSAPTSGIEQVPRVALLLLRASATTGVVNGRPSDFQAWKPPLIEATSA